MQNPVKSGIMEPEIRTGLHPERGGYQAPLPTSLNEERFSGFSASPASSSLVTLGVSLILSKIGNIVK